MIVPTPVLYALLLPVAVIAAALVFELRWARRDYSLKKSRKLGRGFADLLVYGALVRPGVVLNKDGSFMAGWEFRGEDATTKSLGDMRRRVAFINKMFVHKDAGWMFHVDVVRRPSDALRAREYARSDAERVLDAERVADAQARFHNRYVLVATYLPPTDTATKRTNIFVETGQPVEVSFAKTFAAFERGLADVEDSLGYVTQMRRLGERRFVVEHGREVVQDELLEHLVTCIYGDDHPVTVGERPFMLSGLLGAQDLYGGVNPRIGGKYVRAITITGFPMESFPSMLDKVGQLEVPLRFSTRVIVEDAAKARKKLDQAFANWFGKRTGLANKTMNANATGGRLNRDADRMTDDVEEAAASADRGLVRYVYYTAVIVLMDESETAVDENARAVRKVLQQLGFLSRVEEWNAIDAYLGTHPGNGWHNVRKYMLHSLNVGDLLPTTSEWRGRATNECQMCEPGTPPIAIVKTQSGDDFALDTHYQDVQHVLIAGPTGNGKTVAVNFLNANFARAETDQIIGIDFKYGMHRTCEFLGGEHYEPGGDDDALQFCLYTGVEKPRERAWLVGFHETLLELNGVRVLPDHTARIEKALELMARTPPEARCVTTFLQKLADPGNEMRLAFRTYAGGGPYGKLFDGTHDTTRDSWFQVYELSHVMGQKEKAVIPVMLLLFHRIEQRIKQNYRTWVPMDEAWLYLDSPAVAPKVREQLKTFRSFHAGVGLITQSMTDALNSSICDTILDACKTRVLLPNPDAFEAHREFYRKAGMSDQQIANLANNQIAVPKKHYWFQGPDGSGLVDLALTKAELAVYAAGSTDDVVITKRLKTRHPDTWREELMRQYGLDRAADRFAQLRRAGAAQPHELRRGLAIA